ncbi:HD domain-containing phosphohydrolase [Nitratifractor sp.]
MKSGSLLTQLKILTFIPLLILSVLFFVFLYDSFREIRQLQTLRDNTQTIQNVSRLITDLQRERGLSSGYLESGGKRFVGELRTVRYAVDRDVRISDFFVVIHSLRKQIDARCISSVASFIAYSTVIKQLQTRFLALTRQIDDVDLLKFLHPFINLSLVKEALGQIRGSLNGVFSDARNPNKKLLYLALHAKGVMDISLEKYYVTASSAFAQRVRHILASPEYRYVDGVIERIALLTFPLPKEDPGYWFETATKVIDRIGTVEKGYLDTLRDYTQNKIVRTKVQILVELLALLALITFIVWLGKTLRDKILRNVTLLQQYKDAVDRSSIVSKADVGGRITYANDKFCEISGYSREELLGKPHNIVRHPDVPKAVFKEMWQTILDKKPWSGIVKNRKKSGDFYVVEATINPILNHKGEIEEFIAIRNDITEVIKLHEELERTQEEMILRIGEMGEARSQETAQHVRRVAKYSELLGRYYGLDDAEIKRLTVASPMHDIGKVAIPDAILKKPGKLTDEEWEIMKTHAEIGYRLFKDSDKPLMQAAAIIAHEHHEKYDGSGYPRGLKGEEIHIFGRITALADVFDALGSNRYYKKAWSDEEIFAYIRQERGKHFDSKLVDILFEHLDEFLEIRERFR